MRKYIWNRFIKQWFRDVITDERKTENQRGYIKEMLRGRLKKQ